MYLLLEIPGQMNILPDVNSILYQEIFSVKTKIIRSIRQLGVLGHFDPEKINPTPLPDITNGTVDLLYKLEEKANDQFEISGGWGAGMLVGTVGVRFNNFAMRNFFKPEGMETLSFRRRTVSKHKGSIKRTYLYHHIIFHLLNHGLVVKTQILSQSQCSPR